MKIGRLMEIFSDDSKSEKNPDEVNAKLRCHLETLSFMVNLKFKYKDQIDCQLFFDDIFHHLHIMNALIPKVSFDEWPEELKDMCSTTMSKSHQRVQAALAAKKLCQEEQYEYHESFTEKGRPYSESRSCSTSIEHDNKSSPPFSTSSGEHPPSCDSPQSVTSSGEHPPSRDDVVCQRHKVLRSSISSNLTEQRLLNSESPEESLFCSFSDGNLREAPAPPQSPTSIGGPPPVSYDINHELLMEEMRSKMIILENHFDAISDEHGKVSPIATEIRLVELVRVRLEKCLSPQLQSKTIHALLEDFVGVISGIDKCRKELITMEKKKVQYLESMPQLSGSQTRGELMTYLSNASDDNYDSMLKNIEQQSALAIKEFLGNDARGNERKLTMRALKQFCTYSNTAKYFLTILVKLSTAIDVLALFSVDDLDLDDELSECLSNLHQVVEGTELDAASVNTLEIIEVIILPCLRRGTSKEKLSMVRLLQGIKERVLYTRGKGRRVMILSKFQKAASKSISVGKAKEGTATKYFDDRHNRSEIMNVLFSLFLGPEVETKLGLKKDKFFDLALSLSWKKLVDMSQKIICTDFFDCEDSDEENIITEILYKQNRTRNDPIKIVFFNQGQLKSLHTLVDEN